jgi:hypothetical protein
MNAPHHSKLLALSRLIGGTPLLELHCRYRGRDHRIYAKHEAYNFTGSIKDRMALYILQRAYATGEIGPGDVIAEATSGNTGISFAAIGRALGHPVRIYMPDWMSRERVLVIQSLGAAVIPVSAELGGFLGSIRMADEFAREAGRVFRPQQFDNTANVQAHYETTGPEISAQLDAHWAHLRAGLEHRARAALVATTPTLATLDDHDFVGNDSDGTWKGKDVALRAFADYWPASALGTPAVPGVFVGLPLRGFPCAPRGEYSPSRSCLRGRRTRRAGRRYESAESRRPMAPSRPSGRRP